MRNFSGLDANEAIVEFVMDMDKDCLPQEAKDWIKTSIAQPDNLTAVIRTMETLYSYRDECPEGHELAAELASFVSRYNFWGLGGMTGRATQINGIMMRIMDGGEFIEEGDLADSLEYAPPKAQPVETAPQSVALAEDAPDE